MKIIAEFGRPQPKRYHVEWYSVHSRAWITSGHYRHAWRALVAAWSSAIVHNVMTRAIDTGVAS